MADALRGAALSGPGLACDSQTMEDDSIWAWGNVPDDGDVRPFTRNPIERSGANRNNKRHHYIPVTYMKGFADPKGRVWAYRANAAQTPLYVPPESIGYETYYYSQKLPDGTQENHRFEDLWNAIEAVWPEALRAAVDRRLSPAISFNLLGMATIMRTRVPAARERNELLRAVKMRAEVQALEALGILWLVLPCDAGGNHIGCCWDSRAPGRRSAWP